MYRIQKIGYRQEQSLRPFSSTRLGTRSGVSWPWLSGGFRVSDSRQRPRQRAGIDKDGYLHCAATTQQAERTATLLNFLVLRTAEQPSPASALEFQQPELLAFHSSSSASLHLLSCISLPTRAHPSESTSIFDRLDETWLFLTLPQTWHTKTVSIHPPALPPGQSAISDDAVSFGLSVSPTTHLTPVHRTASNILHGRCSLLLMANFSSRWPPGPLFLGSESEGILRNARQRISVLAHLTAPTNPKRTSRRLRPTALSCPPPSLLRSALPEAALHRAAPTLPPARKWSNRVLPKLGRRPLTSCWPGLACSPSHLPFLAPWLGPALGALWCWSRKSARLPFRFLSSPVPLPPQNPNPQSRLCKRRAAAGLLIGPCPRIPSVSSGRHPGRQRSQPVLLAHGGAFD